MSIKLPEIIKKYVDASNAHDVKSILSCFSEDAVVHDEGKKLRGKKAIEDWIVKTIEKYKFQFKPLSVKEDEAEVVVHAISSQGSNFSSF
jgi:ketosteroid isomerase-like protein